jgi:hypothetical protein
MKKLTDTEKIVPGKWGHYCNFTWQCGSEAFENGLSEEFGKF